MLVTEEALSRLDQHWAVLAIASHDRERALEVAKVRLVQSATAHQMTVDFRTEPEDLQLLQSMSLAYEIAAAEGLDALLHPTGDPRRIELQQQAQAGAFRAYEMKRALSVPTSDNEERIFHVLHLAAVAYCGDQWADLRRWIKAHESACTPPSVADVSWDRRVLYRLFDCWVRLLRKRGWDDLDGIREIVAGLRNDQAQYERAELSGTNNDNGEVLAFRLIALYHWAKASELLAVYTLQGEPAAIAGELDKHFEACRKAAQSSLDAPFDMLLHWLHVTARRMVAGSVWTVSHAVNSRISRFIENVTRTRSLFELLPPQRVALQEQGLLDQASRAVIVELPTSGGKTTLAQFRILQALNQFDAEKGWVAYVAPTRALVSQMTRRLREDFGRINIQVEQLTGAVEVDAFEEALLSENGSQPGFHILVSTPEKFQFVIRNKKVTRPLALVVLDEAHNIEDEERGLRIELLLATVKRDSPTANYLLLMPYVPNGGDLARWLGGDAGRTISIGTSAWQPNERVVGLFSQQAETSVRAGWRLRFEAVTTTPRTVRLSGEHRVGSVKPLDIPYSRAKSLSIQAGAMAKVFSDRGTSIAVAQTIPHVWAMARAIKKSLDPFSDVPSEISLVQRFLATEISPEFELIEMLGHGVAVHHTGLSDESRSLIEWLAETGKLRVLCATTTIAQGINFPVSSVFLATRKFPYGKEMSTRAFWNLVGRAGRIGQESVGVVGLAAGNDPMQVKEYVSRAVGDLISRLITLLDEVERAGRLADLSTVIQEEQWADFRCYVAHLWNEKKNLDEVLAETEQFLRNTLGFATLKSTSGRSAKDKADALLEATSSYARRIAQHPENAVLADATGFAPEGVAAAIVGLNRMQRKLSPEDWQPTSLFTTASTSPLPSLIGIMMRIPEIKSSLAEISSHGLSERHIADMARAWVSGKSINDIANQFFTDTDPTDAITHACKAIYKVLVNSGPWGVSALSKMPTSGIDFDRLSDDERRRINSLPAMIYHGVQTEAGVLMRMNAAPRSVAEKLGVEFERKTEKKAEKQTVGMARDFLRQLDERDWASASPRGAALSGADYRSVWSVLAGESLT